MLSYRHGFHAGNHGDVLKHVALVQALRTLCRKEKGFVYIETHAGAGRYRLDTAEALKTGEFRDGIARVLTAPAPPAAVADYIEVIRAANPKGNLQSYPGSPLIARHFLRPQDRAELCELHPADAARLTALFETDRQVRINQEDGHRRLVALLPPRERRGMVLIDPSFEVKSEYETVVETLRAAHRRWATGTYMLWYPVVSRSAINRLMRAVEAAAIRNVLRIELGVRADSPAGGMHASGLLVINPPWPLAERMREALPWLTELLAQGAGSYWSVEQLVPE